MDIESTSMVFGSFSFLVGKENFFFPSFCFVPSFFLLKMHCIFCQFKWNFIAFSYHCSREVGGFSLVITCFCRGVGSVSQKRSMIATDAANPDCITSILNFSTCLLMLLLLVIWRFFISSRVSPGPPKGSNDFLITSWTSLKDPRVLVGFISFINFLGKEFLLLS